MGNKPGRKKGQVKPQAGGEELRVAVMRQAVLDHRDAKYDSRKAAIERWILSCPYQLDRVTAEMIVERLRETA